LGTFLYIYIYVYIYNVCYYTVYHSPLIKHPILEAVRIFEDAFILSQGRFQLRLL
jgi:hypothetical protein